MINIRQNVFETNSSSTHAVAIPTKDSFGLADLPRKINFKVGYFTTIFEEVNARNYLYTAIVLLTQGRGKKFHQYITKIDEVLDAYCIRHYYEPAPRVSEDKTSAIDETKCYIAHYQDTQKWVDSLMADDRLLIRYLLKGRVFTGRDEVESEKERMQVFRGKTTYEVEVPSYTGTQTKKIPNPYYIPGYSWTYLYLN